MGHMITATAPHDDVNVWVSYIEVLVYRVP